MDQPAEPSIVSRRMVNAPVMGGQNCYRLLWVEYDETGEAGLKLWLPETDEEVLEAHAFWDACSKIDWDQDAMHIVTYTKPPPGAVMPESMRPIAPPMPEEPPPPTPPVSANFIRSLDGFGNERWPLKIEFHPDGKQLITYARGGKVECRDPESDTVLDTLERDGYDLETFAISPDASLLAIGTICYPDSDEHGVEVWDWPAKKRLGIFGRGLENNVEQVSFSHDGALFATLDQGSNLDVYDSRTLNLRLSIDSSNAVGFAFHPNLPILAFARRAGTIEWMNAETGEILFKHSYAQNIYSCYLAFHPNGNVLAATEQDGPIQNTIWFFDTESRQATSTIKVDSTQHITALCYHPSGKWLFTGTEGGEILRIDTVTKSWQVVCTGHRDSIIDLAFRQDGRLLASTSMDRTVRVWSIDA